MTHASFGNEQWKHQMAPANSRRPLVTHVLEQTEGNELLQSCSNPENRFDKKKG